MLKLDSKTVLFEEDFIRFQEELEEGLCFNEEEMIELLESRHIEKLKKTYSSGGWLHRYDNSPAGIEQRHNEYRKHFRRRKQND